MLCGGPATLATPRRAPGRSSGRTGIEHPAPWRERRTGRLRRLRGYGSGVSLLDRIATPYAPLTRAGGGHSQDRCGQGDGLNDRARQSDGCVATAARVVARP
jgi:hypothetical protein